MPHKVKKNHISRYKKPILFGLLFALIGVLIFVLVIPISQKNVKRVKNPAFSQNGVDFITERKRWKKIVADEKDMWSVYKKFVSDTKSLEPGQQHLLSHVIGELMFEKIGEASIAVCDATYNYGCYHGVSTSAIAEKGLSEVKLLNNECIKKYGAKNSSPCNHGIGHGIMEFFEHDEAKLNAALHACDATYKETGEERYFGCSSGVFMEFNHPIVIKDDTVIMNTRPVSKGQMYFPCTEVDHEYQPACYHSMAQWWARFDEENYKRLGDLCSKVVEENNKIACFLGIGNIIAPESYFKPELTKERCEEINSPEGQVYCKQAAAILFASDPDRTKKRNIICHGLSASEREKCFAAPPRL